MLSETISLGNSDGPNLASLGRCYLSGLYPSAPAFSLYSFA